MKKAIIIDVAEDGSVVIEAVGYKGGACLAATKAIEEALGKTGNRMKKSEFYQTETNQQKVGLG